MTLLRTRVIEHDAPRRRFWRVTLPWILPGALATGIVVLAPAGLSAGGPAEWDGWRSGTRENGTTPWPDAIIVGRENDGVLYACRGMVNQDMHVGRIRADFGGCHIGFDGREVEIKPFEVLSLSWKPGDAPASNAMVAGTERVLGTEVPFATAHLFVCRASYQGAVHSGQARSGDKGCSFGFGGKRVVAPNYEVLQASPWLAWMPATTRTLPESAVVSGSEGGEPFYACRAADKDGLHPGKVKRGPIGCSIVSNGREAVLDRFEVLGARWVGGHAGTTPVSGYLAGRENGEGQFVCRAQSKDTIQVGKVSNALGGCHVGMRGSEVVLADYEVLSQ